MEYSLNSREIAAGLPPNNPKKITFLSKMVPSTLMLWWRKIILSKGESNMTELRCSIGIASIIFSRALLSTRLLGGFYSILLRLHLW